MDKINKEASSESLKEKIKKPEFLEKWERESYLKGWRDCSEEIFRRMKMYFSDDFTEAVKKELLK